MPIYSLFVYYLHEYLSSPGFFLVSNRDKKTRRFSKGVEYTSLSAAAESAIFYAGDLEASKKSKIVKKSVIFNHFTFLTEIESSRYYLF